MQRDDQDEHDLRPDDDSSLDLRSVLAFVRRRRAVLLIVTLPLLIPASVLPFLMPRSYESTATIELPKREPALDFGRDTTQDRGLAPGALQESIVTLVTSDAVLGVVLDQLPQQEVRARSLEEAAKIFVGLADDVSMSPAQEREIGLEVLRRSLRVGLAGGGDYVAITAVAGTPPGAAFLANAVATAYVNHLADQRESASQRAVTWLNQQIYELRDQTARKEQAAADLIAQGLNPRAFPKDGEEDPALSQLDAQIQTTRFELLAANQRLAEIPRAGRGSAEDPSEAAARARLEEQYAQESAKLDLARLRFTPTHPEVRRLEETVSALSVRLRGEKRDSTTPPTREELAEYQSLSREKGRLDAKLEVLEKSRDEQIAAGVKSDGYSRYRRIESELAIDQQMLGVLMTRRNESMLASAKKDSGLRILDSAVPPLYAAGAQRRKFLALGWAGALAAGLTVAYLLELLDRRMRDPDRIAQLLGMSTLCVLPTIRSKDVAPERNGGRGTGSLAAEAYRSLRTSLSFAMRARKVHTLLITSAIAGEGKTTTSANLAAVFARMGKRVVLVDADMRRPRLHRVFKMSRSPGVSEILSGTARIEDALVKPDGEAFDLIAAGNAPENPTDLIDSAGWNDLMLELKHEYDLVLIDSPVLLAVADSLLLAAQVDGVVLVHKPGSLERSGLTRVRMNLKTAGAYVIGVVFNQIDPRDSEMYPTYLESPYLKDGERRRSFWKSR